MASKFQIPIAFKSDPRGIKEAEGALAGFGKKLAGIGVAVAGAFAIGAVFRFAKESVLAAERAQQFNDILTQVAKTTDAFGGNLTAGTNRLLKFADAQELVIGVEAELIKETQALLLSFKAVGASAGVAGGTFDRATKAAFDMAAVLKTDARGSAVQLGKALENPIKGVTALARAGTTFTEQQREQIKVLVESGKLLEAQELILTEVESQYGGAAEAAALSSQKISLAFGQVQDALGAALAPAFEKFATFFINDVVPPLTKFFEDDFPALIAKFQPVADGVIAFFSSVGDSLKEFLNIDEETSLLQGILDKMAALGDDPEFVGFIDTVLGIFEEMAPVLRDIVFNVGELAAKITPLLTGTLANAIPIVSDFSRIIGGIDYFLGEILDRFGEFEGESPGFLSVLDSLLNPMTKVKEAARLIADAFDAAVRAFERFKAAGGFQGTGVITPPGIGPRRAVGGPVSTDRSYLVGERGPEIFTPGAGGFITPNNRLGGGSSTNINITVNAGMGANGAQLGQEIVSAIKRYERASGPVFASA
jgi:hypothetical protein